jgi:hypothetical protein
VELHMLHKGLLGLLAIIFIGFIGFLGLASRTGADETTPVTCYKDGSRIGTAIVFDLKAAAVTCNSVLYGCRGACIGCFRDSDYINDVCIDTRGTVFLR